MERDDVLTEALHTCTQVRQEEYGHPHDNFMVIRELWSAILGIEVTHEQIAFCMMALKMARHLTAPKRDNVVDIAGYCWVLEQVLEKAGRGL